MPLYGYSKGLPTLWLLNMYNNSTGKLHCIQYNKMHKAVYLACKMHVVTNPVDISIYAPSTSPGTKVLIFCIQTQHTPGQAT